MKRSVAISRAQYGLLVALHAQALYSAASTRSWVYVPILALAVAFVLSRMPAIVRNCRWLLLRPVIVFEITGLLGLAGGLTTEAGSLAWVIAIGGSAAMCLVVAGASWGGDERMPVVSSGFFLFARGHFDDYSARRHLAAILTHVLLVSAGLTLLLHSAPDDSATFARTQSFVIGVAAAMLLTALQVSPQRGLSFLHFGLLALFIGTLAHAIAPSADWPAALIGVGAGLPYCGLLSALLMQVPPRQRLAAMLIALVLIAVAALLGSCVRFLPPESAAWSLAAISFAEFGIFLRWYFREFAEIIQEFAHWPMYRFKSYGPGLYMVPTRGPVLVIANHGAYFDPLFLGKVLPLRVRAWMISTMFDKPFLKWLAGDVYGAIRVPDRPGFRRHMPEIDEAIAVLKRGENMMIFPEAWLRRKEEQPLHRFAQGIVHILKACPNVPIMPAWIEDSWGSYLSYKNGPPTKGKKFDFFYLIRMGFGEPEVLPPKLLEDQKATRKYLMERVLRCRTYLGLPAHPVPGLTSVEDDKEV